MAYRFNRLEKPVLIFFISFLTGIIALLLAKAIFNPSAEIYNAIIAFTALAVSITFGIELRDYNTKTLRPFLSIDRNSGIDHAFWQVTNAGNGPAIILAIHVYINKSVELTFTSNTQLRCLILELLTGYFDWSKFRPAPKEYMEEKYNKDHEKEMLHKLRLDHDLEEVKAGCITLENENGEYAIQASGNIVPIGISWRGTNLEKKSRMLAKARDVLLNSDTISLSLEFTDLYGSKFDRVT